MFLAWGVALAHSGFSSSLNGGNAAVELKILYIIRCKIVNTAYESILIL